jgi:hypothetical protein
MSSLLSIVDSKSRINYDQLKELIKEEALSKFTSQAEHPFLVGKQLYEGELKEAIINSNKLNSGTATMRFSVKGLLDAVKNEQSVFRDTVTLSRNDFIEPESNIIEKSAISRAVFMPRKRPYSYEPDKSLITIGRSDKNDVVISDYVISKFHAVLMFYKDMYFIEDLNSTNGIQVNGVKINPNEKVQLPFNATLSFGRVEFVFTPALQVYRGVKQEILGLK